MELGTGLDVRPGDRLISVNGHGAKDPEKIQKIMLREEEINVQVSRAPSLPDTPWTDAQRAAGKDVFQASGGHVWPSFGELEDEEDFVVFEVRVAREESAKERWGLSFEPETGMIHAMREDGA